MVGYRCYILDAEDHILQAYEIECTDDAHADTVAGDLLARIHIIGQSKCGSVLAGSRRWNAKSALGLRDARRLHDGRVSQVRGSILPLIHTPRDARLLPTSVP